MTPLTPTNLIAVEVPKDAYDFGIRNLSNNVCSLTYNLANKNYAFPPSENKILDFAFEEIIGTIDNGVFDFEAGNYVLNDLHLRNDGYALDYNYLTHKYEFEEPQESFLSLLEENGVLLTNPMGEKPEPISYEEEDDLGVVSAVRNQKIGKWQSYESKVVKGKLLIIEKIKV